MVLSFSFASLCFILSVLPATEAVEVSVSPLTRVEPGFKILQKWKAQKEWESIHDMDMVKDFVTNAHQHLLSSVLKQKDENSSSCGESLKHLYQDLLMKEKYALQALDAAGKPESGLLLGNIQWRGRFYECLKSKSEHFNGKWCSLSIGQQTKDGVFGASIGNSIGMCIPDSCTEEMINYYLEIFSESLNATIAFHCPIQPTEWTSADIISMTVFSILLALVMVGTAIDYYYNCKIAEESKTLSADANEIPIDNSAYNSENTPAWVEIARCFSAIKNTNAILDTSPKKGTIDCLHGIRFISISWIVLAHTYLLTLFYLDNTLDVADWFFNTFSFQAIANGFFGVDTFFFLSGLLVTYLALKESAKFEGKRVPMMYLQRYLRLTPAYAFTILVVVGFFGKLGEGPIWPDAYAGGRKACVSYWWTNLLYINNMHPSELGSECLSVGWYLANDMQFFLLAPISILLLKWRPKIGVNVLVWGAISSILVTGIISAHYKEQPETVGIAVLMKLVINGGTPPTPPQSNNGSSLGVPPPGLSPKDQFWSDLYAKPWCRIGVYLVGMMTGYLLQATKMKIKMTKLFVAFGWAVATALNLALLYGLWGYCKDGKMMTFSLAAFYNAMCRPLWGVGLAWIVVACACGYGGPINAFLSWKFFIPLSRLTFCIYLVHPQVIVWWQASQEVTAHYSNVQFSFFFLGILTFSVGIAYILSILVELPFVNLAKWLQGRKSKEPTQNDREQLLVNELATDA